MSQWWEPYGALVLLRWLAVARAERIPATVMPGAALVDVRCGGGLLAPQARRLGYRHVGVDLSPAGLEVARRQGVLSVRADAVWLPLPDGVDGRLAGIFSVILRLCER